MLGEFAELAMDLARDAAQRARQAEGGAEAAGLMLAFERLGRALRLTVSLQRRLARDSRTDHVQAVQDRQQQVRAALAPALRAEAADLGEHFRLKEELDERLDEEALDEAFAHAPLEACVARIRHLLDLPPEAPANDAGTEAAPAPGGCRAAEPGPEARSVAAPPRQRFGPS
ncbi:MAG TPA: hypothetical protein VGL30_18150 [Phenylobacterium sp.]